MGCSSKVVPELEQIETKLGIKKPVQAEEKERDKVSETDSAPVTRGSSCCG